MLDCDTACVIHTHSAHCVALTLKASETELLPPITPYFVMKVGHVPMIPYKRPGAPETVQAVADVIQRYGAAGTPIRAVMLERLGPNVWHDNPASAMAVLEELEETARLVVLAGGLTEPLTEEQIDDLRTVVLILGEHNAPIRGQSFDALRRLRVSTARRCGRRGHDRVLGVDDRPFMIIGELWLLH
jgi:ribulose-5-phosphate 4-epimerase/fuculose-1-phosphate aldolase